MDGILESLVGGGVRLWKSRQEGQFNWKKISTGVTFDHNLRYKNIWRT